MKPKVGDLLNLEMVTRRKDTRAIRQMEQAVVVGVYKRFVRVKFLRSGIHECFHYEDLK